MGLLRLILWGILFYLAYKVISSLLQPGSRKSEVRGNKQGKPSLDLRNQDVEDADFEDIK